MSIVRNRELSQFGSFIYIDNNQNISITTEDTPYVGIGTSAPNAKLHVNGNTNINGNLTISNGNLDASSYTLNGNPLVNANIEYWLLTSDQQNVYKINGNVGIGTSVPTEKLTVIGNVSSGQFISTVTSGTPPFVVSSNTEVINLNASFLRGKIPPNGNIVGTTDSQTLTNKTLVSPTLNTPQVSSGVILLGSTSGNTTLIASSVASGVLTLPAITDTLIGRNSVDVLTNKTIAAGVNTITGLTNSNLSGSAGITNANLANSTISGVSLGSTLNGLNFGSYLNASGVYNGSIERTVSVAATSANTSGSLVARDASGDFTAGSINCANLTASFTVTAQDINSTSDINLKTNIETVENPIEILTQLRGVSFDWKASGKKSYGVIAQELEQILPDLVTNGEVKSVNYNGLIAVLIEAIKDLKKEIEDLKNTK
jgi:hypothetical protein